MEWSVKALSVLGGHIAMGGNGNHNGNGNSNRNGQERHVHLLLHHSSKLIKLCMLDALVRTLCGPHIMVAARM